MGVIHQLIAVGIQTKHIFAQVAKERDEGVLPFASTASQNREKRVLKRSSFFLVQYLFDQHDLPQVIMGMFYNAVKVAVIASVFFVCKILQQQLFR